MALFALPLIAGAIVCYMLLLYIQSWQRPGVAPTVSAEPAKAAGSFLSRAYHWVTTNLYDYAGPGLIGKLIHGPGHALLNYIEGVTKAALSHQVVALLKPITAELHHYETLARSGWVELGHFAELTHDALYYLRHTAVPGLIRDAVGPVRAIAIDARTLASEAEARLTDFRIALLGALAAAGIGTFSTLAAGISAFVRAFENLHTEVWRTIVPKLDALVTTTIPAILAQDQIFINDLYNTGIDSLEGIRTRLRDIEDFLGKALGTPTDWVLAALGTAAGVLGLTAILTKLWPGLFCKQTQKVANHLCGLDLGLLESILGLSLAFLVVIDPVAIAEAALVVEGEMEGVIKQVAA